MTFDTPIAFVTIKMTVDDFPAQSYMQLAIHEARKCKPVRTAYNVGCVIVDRQSQCILATGFSRELGDTYHAEEAALEKLSRLPSHGSFDGAYRKISGIVGFLITDEQTRYEIRGKSMYTQVWSPVPVD